MPFRSIPVKINAMTHIGIVNDFDFLAELVSMHLNMPLSKIIVTKTYLSSLNFSEFI